MKNKVCPICSINKSETNYYRRSGKKNHLLRSYCIECESLKSKTWRIENIEEYHKSQKTYRDNNGDKRRQRENKYNKENRDKIRKKEQKHRFKYPEKSREKNRKYKSKKRNLQHNFTLKQWYNKVKRTNGICKCGKKFKDIHPYCATLDHTPPISKAPKGFIYTIKHITPLCGYCNNSKGNKVEDYSLLQMELSL